MPTSRSGIRVQQRHDARTLDSEFRGIRNEFEYQGLTAPELNHLLSPFEDLVADRAFWRHQQEGLALFGCGGKLEIIALPYAPNLQSHVDGSFYLLPLVPFLSGDLPFFVLSLEIERIRLFKGDWQNLVEINITDRIPATLEEVVGYEFTGKDLQYRSKHQAYAQAGYHGHDEADRDRKNEILRFFRSVDQGILSLLQEHPAPLVLASQPYLAALYQEATKYDKVHPESINCNLAVTTDTELHQLAWERLAQSAEQKTDQKWSDFLQFLGSGKATTNTYEIFEAIAAGKVDTLFVAQDTPDLTLESRGLLNEAIGKTLGQGGQVFERKAELFPDKNTVMGVLMRFA